MDRQWRRRGPRRFRARRAAFWSLSPQYLSVAVVCRGPEEPVLEACAAQTEAGAAADGLFAPGLLEMARRVDSLRLSHVVAIDDTWATLRAVAPAVSTAGVDRATGQLGAVASASAVVTVDTDSGAGWAVSCPADVVAAVQALFGSARLRLIEVDAAACARHTLRSVLGTDAAETTDTAAPEPLAAVSVAARAEEEALALGAALVVPVGLALARFVDNGDDLAL